MKILKTVPVLIIRENKLVQVLKKGPSALIRDRNKLEGIRYSRKDEGIYKLV